MCRGEMGKSIVIYTSKRGSTKQYAAWIAEELGCEAMPLSDALKHDINLYEYDCIIYGGWIRGSGIVDFDKFAKTLDDDLMKRLIVYGVGFADETAENYAQVWGYSLGKVDPENKNRVLMYILGGRYDPSKVSGMDKFLMKIMRTVLLSGSTPDAKMQANKIKDRIDNGIDMVSRDNIISLVKDARKIIDRAEA
jgi:menaquinone-dependent protoporphyrinogen IX oxidase